MGSRGQLARAAGILGIAALGVSALGCQPGTDDQGAPRAVQVASAQESGPAITVFKSPT